MEPYNVKVITYPDLTRQFRIYRKPVIYQGYFRKERYRNPFDHEYTREIEDDIGKHFEHITEVSLKRTKKRIYDYSKSNVWEWFVTFTFSQHRVNRYDYNECTKKLSKWLNHLRRSSPALSYLVVPEQHKDGAWHFHGLFSGLSDREIVWSGRYVIKRVCTLGRPKFVQTEEKIYKIGRYNLGWMTATKVKYMERVTSYITKYITKDMLSGLYGKKRYWCSRNLLKPVEEVYMMDQTDRFILSSELDEVSRFKKISEVCYGNMTQSVNLYEV